MPKAKSQTDWIVGAERAVTGIVPEKVDAVLSDPKNAAKWSQWIKKIEAVQNEVYEATTSDGKFLIAWWYRSDTHTLVLRFKWGYYAADAHYGLSGEGDKAELKAHFPTPPPGYKSDPEALQKRLETELEMIEKFARKN